MTPVALTIAGSDPSGGAGIQADLKTFHQFGVYGTAAITLIAVQNTMRVHRVEVLAGSLVGEQIVAVLEDIPPQAAKTGALGSAAVIEAVVGAMDARTLPCPLVVDPVMLSSRGAALLDADGREALISLLLPRAALLTPNLAEAASLAAIQVDSPSTMRHAAERIAALGPRSVLVKGGHLEGDAVDVLFHEGAFLEFSRPRIATRHTHGTGCTYSAAITACLAMGDAIPVAVERAKDYIHRAIAAAPGLGSGQGPLNHRV